MSKRTPDLRALAQRQRWLIWLVLLSQIPQLLPFLPLGQFGVVVAVLAVLFTLALLVLVLVGVVLVLIAQGVHVLMIIVCSLLLFVPCINLLVMLRINRNATNALRQAGLHVGLMGVAPEEVERVLNPNLCAQCGYNLTGSVSGFCTECGAVVAPRPHSTTGR